MNVRLVPQVFFYHSLSMIAHPTLNIVPKEKMADNYICILCT